MGWSKNYSTLSRHRKVQDLAKILGVNRFEACGLVVAVHNYAVDFEPDGDLSGYDDESLANQVGWKRRGVGIKTGMIRSRLLDDSGMIHDWPEYQGSYKEAEKKRRQRERARNESPSRDCPGTVPARGEERRREERRGEEKEIDPGHADAVRAVFQHWKLLHPHSFPRVHSKLKEWKIILARLGDGYDAADLIEAIEGMHRSPWNLGMNEHGKAYLSLELCVRDAKHVEQYREMPLKPRQPLTGKALSRRMGILAALKEANGDEQHERDRSALPRNDRKHLGQGAR